MLSALAKRTASWVAGIPGTRVVAGRPSGVVGGTVVATEVVVAAAVGAAIVVMSRVTTEVRHPSYQLPVARLCVELACFIIKVICRAILLSRVVVTPSVSPHSGVPWMV